MESTSIKILENSYWTDHNIRNTIIIKMRANIFKKLWNAEWFVEEQY